MPTYALANRAGQQPSAPLFLDRFNVTFATPADDYPAGGGFIIGLQARIGAGRTILGVVARGAVAASGDWDRVHWHYDAVTDMLAGFLVGPRNATVAWVPGQAPAARNDTVANLAADVVFAGAVIPTGSVMAVGQVELYVYSF